MAGPGIAAKTVASYTLKMTLTRDELFASPDHYLHSLDGDAAVFVPMDRAAYHRSIFLDGRISPAASGSMRLPLAALTDSVPVPQTTAWIFHVAHCGSTLLARALDQLASNLVLREPLALRQLAIEPDSAMLAMVAAMVSKRYRADLTTIVKANVPVNFLLPDLIGSNVHAPAIFLHLDLRDYLLAILRSDSHRAWLRRITTLLGTHLGDLSEASDAQRAAALWLAQMQRFVAASAVLPQARSLDAERFFATPDRILQAAATLFQVPLSAEASATITTGPLFVTYSKDPSVRFGNVERLARRATAEAALAGELDEAARWIEAQGDAAQTASAALAAIALVA